MKISIFSDLHLEFYDRANPNLDHKDADLIINVGDTHPNPVVREGLANLYNDRPYFEVLGNHDYYKFSSFPFDDDGQKILDMPDGTKIIGCTLWSHIPIEKWEFYKRQMSCATMIKNNTQQNMASKHKSDLEFIKNTPADVVVTHFSPSMRGVSSRFVGDSCNSFFHNQLDAFILDLEKPPKVWIHGHTHDACSYKIGETLVVCHPRGYPGENSSPYQPIMIELGKNGAKILSEYEVENSVSSA